MSYHRPQEDVGAVIAGKYKLLEALGQGGMGAVFMAQQTQPVKRVVALKLIKLGMDSKQVLRFEAERQALALMDHPNIAKVLDAGTTDSGRRSKRNCAADALMEVLEKSAGGQTLRLAADGLIAWHRRGKLPRPIGIALR